MHTAYAVVSVDNKAVAVPLAGLPMGTETLGTHFNLHDADLQAQRINALISKAMHANYQYALENFLI